MKGNGSDGQEREFDWVQVRARLEASIQALSGEQSLSEAELRRIWSQRAARLAEVEVEEDDSEHLDLVLVRLGDEIYGLEATYVDEIRPLQQITRVPRTPPWITGVVNVRGRILSIFDLGRFLDLPTAEQEGTGQAYVVVVSTPEMELALLTDEVLTVDKVPLDDLEEASATARGVPRKYVRGVGRCKADGRESAGTLIVLDLQLLLADEALRIREEIS
ncbi:MAG: chemotaxis protein CheW [Anaerolineales bacterium]